MNHEWESGIITYHAEFQREKLTVCFIWITTPLKKQTFVLSFGCQQYVFHSLVLEAILDCSKSLVNYLYIFELVL